MSSVTNFLKKFLKWTAIVVVILMVIAFFSARYSDYKYQIANTVDEEMGLFCSPIFGEGAYRYILQSTPNSRKYSKYWENIKIVKGEQSELDENKYQVWFVNADNVYRTLDYVVAVDRELTMKFNRQNFSLSMYDNTKDPEVFIGTVPCEVEDADSIRDFVKKKNEDGNILNIL
jgi:hypothetical protein